MELIQSQDSYKPTKLQKYPIFNWPKIAESISHHQGRHPGGTQLDFCPPPMVAQRNPAILR
jgi:hypothetical protein